MRVGHSSEEGQVRAVKSGEASDSAIIRSEQRLLHDLVIIQKPLFNKGGS